MLGNLRRIRLRLTADRRTRRAAARLYALAVEQARSPVFYRRGGVPDTLDGRFDLVVLHVWLLLLRLRRVGASVRLQRALQETAIADYDRSLRELGVGDLSVGRRVRQMARAQAGRFRAYDDSLEDDAALRDALARNLWRGDPPAGARIDALAKEIRRQHLHLESLDRRDLESGRAIFLPAELS